MQSSKSISFGAREIEAICATAASEDFGGNGNAVISYENSLSNWSQSSYALSCSSGTAALYLALKAVGVGPTDEVIVSPLGAVMTALPILELGAKPVFVDTASATSFIFRAESVAARLTERTKAILTASMWGYPSIDDEMIELSSELRIPLIEDAAQAHGSSQRGRLLGTFGHIGCFSTHARKLVNTGEGGFLLTDCGDCWERMHELRTLGQRRGDRSFGTHRGMNFKLSGLLAAVGESQIGSLDSRIAEREGVGARWHSALEDVVGLAAFERPDVHNGYGFAVAAPAHKERIDAALYEAGVLETDTLRYGYSALYRSPVFSDYRTVCANAEALCDQIVVLPCHGGISDSIISAAVGVIEGVIND